MLVHHHHPAWRRPTDPEPTDPEAYRPGRTTGRTSSQQCSNGSGKCLQDLLAEVDNCDLIGLATSLQDACGAELLKGGSCPCSDECQTALLDIEPACVASLGEFMCSRAVEARQDGVELKETV